MDEQLLRSSIIKDRVKAFYPYKQYILVDCY